MGIRTSKTFFSQVTTFIASLIFIQSVSAQTSCLLRQDLVRNGYLLNSNQMQILMQNHVLPRNKNKTRETKITSVENSISNTWRSEQLGQIKASQIATLIVDVADKVGIDYQILAAIIQKESNYCRYRLNTTGGDSGCMQFTTPALTEIKHQLGLAGKDKHSSGMPEILLGLAYRFLSTLKGDQLTSYKKWISLDINRIKETLRNDGHFEFDILTGAIYLKINLALAQGRYGIAVRNYNGSKKKLAYESSVMSNAAKVFLYSTAESETQCLENEQFEVDVFMNSCEFEDDSRSCVQDYAGSNPYWT